jgi:glutamate dehydrogenase/leucine dehydrogenase
MHGEKWDKKDVFKKLKDKMDSASKRVYDISKKMEISLREAAYVSALKILSKKTRGR